MARISSNSIYDERRLAIKVCYMVQRSQGSAEATKAMCEIAADRARKVCAMNT